MKDKKNNKFRYYQRRLFEKFKQFSRKEDGSITAEFAILTPVIVFMLAIILCVISFGIQTNKCNIAAKEVARNLLVSESRVDNLSIAAKIIGSTPELNITNNDGYSKVVVKSSIIGGLLSFLPKIASGEAIVYTGKE